MIRLAFGRCESARPGPPQLTAADTPPAIARGRGGPYDSNASPWQTRPTNSVVFVSMSRIM